MWPTTLASFRWLDVNTSPESPRNTCAVPSRKSPFGAGIRCVIEKPVSFIPSSPATRFSDINGRSMVCSAWLWMVFDFPNSARNFPTPRHKTRRQRRECHVRLFDVHACFSEGNENVAAGVWINDGMQAHFHFMQLERRYGTYRVPSQRARHVPDRADGRVEKLCRH